VLVSRLTDLAPRTSRPSSVNVPVLSKHMTSTVPATLTRFGEIQNICCFRKRDNANDVPIVNVAGNAGGTIIVIKSNARTIIKRQCIYVSKFKSKHTPRFIKLTIDTINPSPAMIAMTPIKRNESR
jgi:hypothetical protein